MAVNNVKIIKNGGPNFEFQAEDRTTSSITVAMQLGEPVKVGGTGTNFVLPLLTGDCEIGTDEFVGIVAEESTETSTVDGTVLVTQLIPGLTMLRAQATTVANINTVAKLLALRGDWISFDVTGAGTNGPTGVFTLDEDEATDPNVHCCKIMDGDITKGSLDVIVHANATQAAPLTGQTMD